MLCLDRRIADHLVHSPRPTRTVYQAYQNVLAFADSVLCPASCDYLSMVGVRQMLRTLRNVNTLLGHSVRLWGVLPTMYQARSESSRAALEVLREEFLERCFDPVRDAVCVREAPAHGVSLLEYAPESGASADYLQVVDRLLNEGDWSNQTALRA